MTEASVGQTSDRIAVNARRAEKRREVSRAVRDVRERLTSTTGTSHAFDYEITLSYARNRLSAALPIPILVVLVGVLAGFVADPRFVLAWAAAVCTAHLLVVTTCRRFLDAGDAVREVAPFRRRVVLLEAGYGLAWALLLLVSGPLSAPLQSLEFATVLIVVAASSMLASNILPAVAASALPVAIGGAIHLALAREVTSYILAACTIGALVFFYLLAQRLGEATLATIGFRAEKDALIAELEQANAISDESRRRAEEANLAKSKFLATMSHELRTPLNAILGFSEIIKGEVFGPIGNANYKDYVTDIHSSGQHLLNLINEILDLSRIEAGKYKLNEEAVRLADVVDDCHHLMVLRAKGKDIKMTAQVEPNLPKLWADERATRQIVLNLLSNAVKFTQPGGEIAIKLGWTAGGGQYVAVRDNGPGIPDNEIPIVLSAFGQGSVAVKSAEQGTGLGLNIVQAIVAMHGGTFTLNSKLREGTEVVVTFPRSRVMEAMPPITEERGRRRSG